MMSRRCCLGRPGLHNRAVGWHVLQERTAQCAICDFDGSLFQFSGSGTPSGTVTVRDGSLSCAASVATGNCSITFLTTGTKTLTATYAGDSNFIGSTSADVLHTVNNLVPTLVSLSHSSSVAGSPGFTLVVTGTNFIPGSVVQWNGSTPQPRL